MDSLTKEFEHRGYHFSMVVHLNKVHVTGRKALMHELHTKCLHHDNYENSLYVDDDLIFWAINIEEKRARDYINDKIGGDKRTIKHRLCESGFR